MTYKRIAVAVAFSPTFSAVMAEARRFAAQCDATLDIIHGGAHDPGKEARFLAALGQPAEIRWMEAESPAQAIAAAAKEYDYELVIAGALQREDGDKPFISGVARDLLRIVPADLLLIPGPSMEGDRLKHGIFAFEPGEDCFDFLSRTVESLGITQVTIAAPETPFAAAMAASRGQEPCDVQAWSQGLETSLQEQGVEADTRIVTSNTGYTLCDAVLGIAADLLVVQAAPMGGADNPLPMHMNWLYQVIPMRLLVVRGSAAGSAPE